MEPEPPEVEDLPAARGGTGGASFERPPGSLTAPTLVDTCPELTNSFCSAARVAELGQPKVTHEVVFDIAPPPCTVGTPFIGI